MVIITFRARVVLKFLFLLMLLPAIPSMADDAPTSAVVMKETVLRDPARGNMPAIRVLVPKGWSIEGGVSAVPSGYGMIPYLGDVRIKSPDKRGVHFWGINEYGYADGVSLYPFTPYQGRPFFPLQPSLGAFWQALFKLAPAAGVTDLEIIDEEVVQDATQLVQRHLQPLYQSTQRENARLMGTGERKSFDAHARKLVIRYRDEGVPVEATVFATVRHSIYYRSNGMIRAAMWNLDNMYAVFGPVGTDYLADPVLAAIVRSKTDLPEWQAAVEQWYLMKNRQIVAEGRAKIAAAARQAAAAKTSQSDDVLDISFNGWKKRNSMSDAGQTASVMGIREQTTYGNPDGTTIDLPSYYQNVYTDNSGNYVLHDDANYQINTDPAFNGTDWQRIEPAQ